MYHASKRLQAIRQQLKQMNEQYRNGVDEFEPVTMAEPISENRNENAHEISGAGVSNLSYSTTMSLDNQKEQVSSSINIGADLESLVECTTSEVAEIPLSEELRCAIFNMEDLNDVDNIIGNVMNSVLVESAFDEDLESVEQTGNSSNSSTTEQCHTHTQSKEGENPSPGNSTRNLRIIKDEENWRKERRKKDNHNIIERRRRYNINDRIKELATLLPASVPHDLKQNKGSILKASVEYMKELMRDKSSLQKLKEHQRSMNSKYQKLLIRIFQLELKLKLYGLSEELDHSRVKKKKKPKKRISEINAMVEDLVKQDMPEILEPTPNISTPPCKRTKDGALLPNNKQKFMPPSKLNLRQHLEKKMSEGGPSSSQSDDSSLEVGLTDQVKHLKKQKKEPISLPLHSNNVITEGYNEQCDSILYPYTYTNNDKAGSDINDEEGMLELSTEECSILLDLFENNQNEDEPVLNTNFLPKSEEASANQGCLSPVTSTCNMLESLLRKQDTASECCSRSGGLEDSTESVTGLR
ncbi:uncharacterized protein LOC133172144 [Saccostrea echinata]|uniref:uncharacterized protein LOC133172144 n=1 Tax=Saccostrea echinata TaxID=191078 RepID=UPI002A83E66A|nr:uncharacterized protein LOC133172144 [Saccostrea echinata]